MSQPMDIPSVPWILRPQNHRKLRLTWAVAGSVVGTAIFGVAEGLLDHHMPLSLGAIGGLFIGIVEAQLIVRRLNEAFLDRYPAHSPSLQFGFDGLDSFPSGSYVLARRYLNAVFWAALVTALGMAHLLGAIVVPSLGLAAVATGCAVLAGALLNAVPEPNSS